MFDHDADEVITTSAKAARRVSRKEEKETRQLRRTPKPLEPRTRNQTLYKKSLEVNSLTFAEGPAGVGKTYVPARIFGEWLSAGKIEKIYLARPNIAKPKHRMGFLPGSADEKMAPWLIPIMEGLKDSMGVYSYENYIKSGAIEIVPYEFMQGRTFASAACIVDEAENLDLDDLYITLTRQGEGLTMVLCGDMVQARIPDSGFAEVIKMSFTYDIRDVGVINFTEEDVVRSKQAYQWVKAFKNHTANKLKKTEEYGRDTPLPRFITGG